MLGLRNNNKYVELRYQMVDFDTFQSLKATKAKTLESLRGKLDDYDVIGIDEGQFFTDIVEFAEKAANDRKVVIISSLQGTFLRGTFPNILALLPKCEKIKKLSAICKLCKESASFTFRTASKDSKQLIGGDDMYMPLCRECHARESNLNRENTFMGDPTIISADLENKLASLKKKEKQLSDNQ